LTAVSWSRTLVGYRLLGRKARIAIVVTTLLLIAAPWTDETQQTGKFWRIGYLSL
jgi:hypothetical protein